MHYISVTALKRYRIDEHRLRAKHLFASGLQNSLIDSRNCARIAACIEINRARVVVKRELQAGLVWSQIHGGTPKRTAFVTPTH